MRTVKKQKLKMDKEYKRHKYTHIYYIWAGGDQIDDLFVSVESSRVESHMGLSKNRGTPKSSIK